MTSTLMIFTSLRGLSFLSVSTRPMTSTMGMPSMTETMGGAMGRTVIIVVAWIGSVVFALVALFALAAVFAPLIGLATI